MPRKKSVKGAASRFVELADGLDEFYRDVLASSLSAQQVTWACDAAVIKLQAYFERLMLHALVGAINNDTSTISAETGIPFPPHLRFEVCEFLVTGGGYFDFRGRSGLIRLMRKFVPESHYLVVAVKRPRYKEALERVFALRNYAAHESGVGKKTAAAAVGQPIGAAGEWVKRQGRFLTLSEKLKDLARDTEAGAPF